MVKERPAFFYILALATGVLLYAEWPFITGILDLFIVAVATVLVVTAISLFRPKGRLGNFSLAAAVFSAGLLWGIMLAAINDREEDAAGHGWVSYVESGAAAVRG